MGGIRRAMSIRSRSYARSSYSRKNCRIGGRLLRVPCQDHKMLSLADGNKRRFWRLSMQMSGQLVPPSFDVFAQLRAAMVADITRHVGSLRQSGIAFYGYAVLPPDYYTQFDPTTIAVAFNREPDVEPINRDQAYYRYSVDEWNNYVHDGFDAVNRELQMLLMASRPSLDDPIDNVFVESVYQAILDAMLTLRGEGVFDDHTFLVVWLSDSDNGIMNRSARMLNPRHVFAEFASEFGE